MLMFFYILFCFFLLFMQRVLYHFSCCCFFAIFVVVNLLTRSYTLSNLPPSRRSRRKPGSWVEWVPPVGCDTHIYGVGPRLLALVLGTSAPGNINGGVLAGAEVAAVERAVSSESDTVLVEVLAVAKLERERERERRMSKEGMTYALNIWHCFLPDLVLISFCRRA